LRRIVVPVASLALAAGCAYLLRYPEVRPITRLDPVDYGVERGEHRLRRELTREEKLALGETVREELRDRIERYISSRHDLGEERKYRLRNAPVTPGLTREEVALLLGEPGEVTRDPSRIKQLASKHWSRVRDITDEAWMYQGLATRWGHRYVLYFRDDVLHSMTEFYWGLL
jgi:hypothetical protein